MTGRLSFEDGDMTDDEASAQRNSGIKLKPSSTRQEQKQVKQSFRTKVMDTNKRLEGHLQDAYELGMEFHSLMSEKRVPENIGPYERSFEQEIIRKLINYSMTVNRDPNEQEGMGSISLITLLLKSMFKLRDKMNQVSYDNHKLERRVLQLEKTIMSHQAQKTILSSQEKIPDEGE